MKKNMIILSIVTLIILVVTIIVIIINISESTEFDGEEYEVYDTTNLESQIDDSTFLTTISCINIYIESLKNDSTAYYGEDDEGNYVKLISEQELGQNRYNLLNKKYIEKNNVTLENINNKVKILNKETVFTPIKLKMKDGEKNKNVIIYGILTEDDNKYIDDVCFIVRMDKNNKTFNIEPTNNNVNNLEFEYEGDSIEKLDNNIYNIQKSNIELISKQYLTYYKRLVLLKTSFAYSILEEKYKNEKFNEYGLFEKYVNNNKEEIEKIYLKEYNSKYDGDTRIITLKDQYSNIYTIYENNIMDFTIRLDNYTILEDEILEKYNSSTNLNKINMQLARIIESINNKDYEFTYKRINEEFKKQNFANINEFENFIKNNFFDKNEINNISYTEENEIYILSCTIKNSNNSDETKNIKILIKLLENTELEISFSK